MSVSIDDFSKIELKVGKVTSVEDVPLARKPMYKLLIDFGDGTIKQCVAGIKPSYEKERLIGKQVIAVVNLPPKSVVGVLSEVMMLAAFNDTELSLLMPDKEMPLGTRVG